MNWTEEDIKKTEQFIEIKNKGYYADGTQVTEVYNRVLGRNVPPTNCGSCLRQRVTELETELNHYKTKLKASESVSETQPTDTKAEEKEEPTTKNKKVKK